MEHYLLEDNLIWDAEFTFERLSPHDVAALALFARDARNPAVKVLLSERRYEVNRGLLDEAGILYEPIANGHAILRRQLTTGVGTLVPVSNVWSLAHVVRLVSEQHRIRNQGNGQKPSPIIAINRLRTDARAAVPDTLESFHVQEEDNNNHRIAWNNMVFEPDTYWHGRAITLLSAYAATYIGNN